MKIEGRCHCGFITYEAKIDPAKVMICHCTDCQTPNAAPRSTPRPKGTVLRFTASGSARASSVASLFPALKSGAGLRSPGYAS